MIKQIFTFTVRTWQTRVVFAAVCIGKEISSITNLPNKVETKTVERKQSVNKSKTSSRGQSHELNKMLGQNMKQ